MPLVKTHEDYERAERVMANNIDDSVFNGRIKPNWFSNENQFWYKQDLRMDKGKGKRFVRVAPSINKCEPAFNHEKLAIALEKVLNKPCDPNNLPFDEIEFAKDGMDVSFMAEQKYWTCSVKDYSCIQVKKPFIAASNEVISPDRQWVAFTKECNLYVKSLETEDIIQVTFDGESYYDYSSHPETRTTVILEKLMKFTIPPAVIWSPDSKKLLTYRLDQRLVKKLHLLQSVTDDEDIRPRLHTYRYSMPGDEFLATANLLVYSLENKSVIWVDYNPLIVNFVSPLLPQFQMANWTKDSSKIYFFHMSRNHKCFQLLLTDAQTGSTRKLIEEKNDTFVNLAFHNMGVSGPNVHLLEKSNQLIWHSERDGWSHLYLYDMHSGKMINQITSGQWVVRSLLRVDEEQEWIYFTAGGREKGRDPYYQHLYRVRFDSTELTLLTPEDAEHDISMPNSMKYFVDKYSRVDLPPVTVLRSIDGSLISVLEKADIALLLSEGYQIPKRFTVKASDGVTDIYGVIYLPTQIDKSQKYPVIDYVYGGPQRVHTPKAFTWGLMQGKADVTGSAQSFVQLGFAVVIIDGMGTPYRSKVFHDRCYTNIQDAAGLIDHITGIKQLTEVYPFLDLERVGIWGSSGGGYASARGVFKYPEFYKVAVSVCGNHNLSLYLSGWGELYQGIYDAKIYKEQDNARIAKNLEGQIMLVHGDMDDNVHPANTLRIADALIKANKDFDLLILPNRFHSIGLDPYFTRRKWDFFVKNLMKCQCPKEYIIGAKE
jgi:dipeptidyl aminopeptidase/acylaminoacyl peptidase